MDVVQNHIPVGHPNRPGTKLRALKAIVIHYTQNDSPGATDTANVKYIGRSWEKGTYWSKSKNEPVDGPIEKGSTGKGDKGLGIGFRYGSAHIFCDMDSITEAIPTDEVAWGTGDRNYKGGFQRIAEKVFKFRQNYESIGIEICNNDVIKDSLEDWETAVENAKLWLIEYLLTFNLKVDKVGSLFPQGVNEAPPAGTVLLLRHFDITGKLCPKPFIDTPADWKRFVEEVALAVNNNE